MEANATHVAVLMAVKNGSVYLPEQIDSIINQQDCQITLFISDDCSSDGSMELLQQYEKNVSNIKLLPKTDAMGSAALNFYRLIVDVKTDDFDYIAFSDQDDIWLPNKLSRHIQLAREHSADGVSSNVTAFWPNGRKQLLNKAQPQRELDYLFESAGPGCTFLMTPRLISKVREHLLQENSLAKTVALHDWLTYAICRASGWRWIIDFQSSVHYRQHQSNVLGANVGLHAKWSRILRLKEQWYRSEIIKVTSIINTIAPNSEASKLIAMLENKTGKNRLKLLGILPRARRKTADRWLLAGAILFGLF